MNEKHIYYFTIKAESPLYFGGNDRGQLLEDAEGFPFVSGNSIGGALRENLQTSDVPQELILSYLGGSVPQSSVTEGQNPTNVFKESRIYISNGAIASANDQKYVKEGTAIDNDYGSARHHSKYTMEYLPEGTVITFQVECDLERSDSKALESIIHAWASGLDEGRLCLGGKKSNGFGRFSLSSLKLAIYKFDHEQALDDYIFNRRADGVRAPVDLSNLQSFETAASSRITISVRGSFPYGVYQAYKDTALQLKNNRTVTGLQNSGQGYFIPSSSIKGLLKQEVRVLMLRMLADTGIQDFQQKADRKCEELFGSKEQRGIVVVSDVKLVHDKCVTVDRPSKEDEDSMPVYIKIDRLTGSVLGSALKHQNEVQGEAELRLELLAFKEKSDVLAYLFPLVYVLRSIGAGKLPIGGRTVIGLGEFFAAATVVSGTEWTYEIANSGTVAEESKQWLESSYEAFVEWVKR